MAKKTVSFEEQLEALKIITKQLEGGQMPLEDSLKLFENGIKLYRECSAVLEKAERQVTQLIDGEEKDFTSSEDNS